ncbi:MAG: 2,3-bisphosphoglycerate-independent phosphoglycerate mutase [bacterium]|nr:2,3-bisphosphoglycerate-independent phosphoglycerate mutase [bacterium]
MATTVLCILDGWGIAESGPYNALSQAKLPFWNHLLETYPHTELQASETFVGLPQGQMGNSEVGHMNIGAGRLVPQDLPRINDAFAQGHVAKTPTFKSLAQNLKKSGGACHLMGLFSPGGVHSHQNHILQLAKELSDQKIPVILHAFLDGRDTPPTSACDYIKTLEDFIAPLPLVSLGTISGRFYAMDRDKRWDRVEKAFQALVYGTGERAETAQQIFEKSYRNEITDEFLLPTCLGEYSGFNLEKDGILMANFRADRAREIMMSLLCTDFNDFGRGADFIPLPKERVAGMTEYSSLLKPLCPAIFPPISLKNTLGQVVSDAKKTQLRLAETEKYAHVTFFLNGGREAPFPGEKRRLIQSPKVKTYDQKPEMSAFELTDTLVEALESDTFDLIVVNYANPDMVGHTGNLKAASAAAEVIDQCLKRVVDSLLKHQGQMLVTADHGNLEQMFDETTGKVHTAHTCNPVPGILVSEKEVHPLSKGTLCDIAPTILDLMGLPIPKEMDCSSLIHCQNKG